MNLFSTCFSDNYRGLRSINTVSLRDVTQITDHCRFKQKNIVFILASHRRPYETGCTHLTHADSLPPATISQDPITIPPHSILGNAWSGWPWNSSYPVLHITANAQEIDPQPIYERATLPFSLRLVVIVDSKRIITITINRERAISALSSSHIQQ